MTKISDEYTKWTEPYFQNSKHDALSSFQVFVQSVVNPSGFRVERLRVDKGGGFISEEFQGYCLQTGVSLEYDSTNTPQQIGMSERVGRTLVAMLRCILPAADCQNFSGEIFVFMAALLGNIAPHSAIGMQSPYKMPYLSLIHI